ncbi:MAG TPA: SDR family oxidoreductase [Candidatus Binatia bacterium]|nr:SDR family oxidoreductase [Candidatus Binatia bacterium]
MSESGDGGVRGRRVIVTGATNGIGLAAAVELARRGALLTLVARSAARGDEAVARVRDAAGDAADVDVLLADLSSLASVRGLAAEVLSRYPNVDVLVNNAGAMYTRRQVTEDGFEQTWALNHLAPFLLTTLLLDRLRESAPARIVTTSSDAHGGKQVPFDDLGAERSYDGMRRYGQTKLANILFTSELARRLEGSEVTANCFHPGFVGTGFARNNGPLLRIGMSMARPFARSPERGADTLVWLVDSPDVAAETGGYFVDRRRVTPSAAAQDTGAAERLWEVSQRQVELRV